MKKKDETITKKTVVKWFFQTIVLIALLSCIVLIAESQSANLQVTVSVVPNRIIIVNNDFIIQRIISNTKDDVRPVVFLDSEDGIELPYSDSILQEYQYLKPTLNFSQPGIVYEREDRIPIALIKRIWRTIKTVLRMPF